MATRTWRRSSGSATSRSMSRSRATRPCLRRSAGAWCRPLRPPLPRASAFRLRRASRCARRRFAASCRSGSSCRCPKTPAARRAAGAATRAIGAPGRRRNVSPRFRAGHGARGRLVRRRRQAAPSCGRQAPSRPRAFSRPAMWTTAPSAVRATRAWAPPTAPYPSHCPHSWASRGLAWGRRHVRQTPSKRTRCSSSARRRGAGRCSPHPLSRSALILRAMPLRGSEVRVGAVGPHPQ